MAEITKQALKVDNNTSFPNNNNGAITPAILRAFNVNMIDSMVDELGYNVDSASWNQQIDSLEQFTASLATTFVSTASFNAYTASNNTKWDDAAIATASLFTSVTNLNTTTASLLVETQNLELFSASALVSISNLNQSSASQQVSINSLNAATASYVTETESGSFLLTASFDNGTRNLTFTKGDASTFAVNIPDISGSTGNFATTGSNIFIGDQTISGSLFVSGSEVLRGTLSASALRVENNTYLDGTLTVTNDTLINGDVTIQSATPNLKLRDTSGGGFSSGYDLRVDTGSFEIYDDTHNRDVLSDFFNSGSQKHTTSLTSEIIVISGSTSVTLIGNVSASIISASTINGLGDPLVFSTSVDSRLDSLEGVSGSFTTTASFNSYTSSTDSRLNNIEAATSSYVTSAITASSLVTASAVGNTITFTKGDASTFNVSVASTPIDTGSFATTSSFNAYTQSNDQRVSSLEANSGSVNTSITNINSATSSLQSATASLFTSASLALVTASFDTGSRNLTFTKGDATTFAVNIPDTSGSATINTGSFATTGSNAFVGNQTINGTSFGTGANTGTASIAIGNSTLQSNTGQYNIAIGETAGQSNSSGYQNVAIGLGALQYNQNGSANVGIGGGTFRDNISGSNNTFVGGGAGINASSVNYNVGIGSNSLSKIQSNENTAVGANTLLNTTTGNGHTAMGFDALKENTTGTQNTALGYAALQNNTTGLSNTGLGAAAGRDNQTGAENVFIGWTAAINSGNASDNVVIGARAGSKIKSGLNTIIGQNTAAELLSGSRNTIMGRGAASSGTGFDNNTIIGETAATNITTGNNNTIIGQAAGVDVKSGNLNIFIGQNAGRNVSGSANTFIGAYNGIGNESGVIALSDGNQNVRAIYNSGWTFTGSVDISGSLTASLAQGFTYVGDANGRTVLVATSSFGGGGSIATGSFATTGSNTFTGDQTLIDAAGNSITLSDVSGSLMLVPKGFTSSSLHISASASGSGNVIFKTNNFTVDTIISGSANIFQNAFTATAGFKRYIGGSGNYFNTSILPQISGSMQFSPAMNRNIGGGAYVFRAPVSSSTYTINDNLLLNGAVNFGTAAAPFTGMVAGCNFQQNIFAGGTINMTSNVSTLDFASNINTNIIFGATVNINNNSSSVSYISNIQNGGITINNNYVPVVGSTSAFRTAYASINTVYGVNHRIDYAGTNATTSSLRSAIANLLAGTYITASIQETGDSSSLIATNLMGNGLIVSGTSLNPVGGATPLADATIGTVISGRFNAVDGNRAKTAQTIFAIGTGTGHNNRKTGFLIDSGSNTFIEGTLNVSGSTSLTGSLTITGSGTINGSPIVVSNQTGSNVISIAPYTLPLTFDCVLGNNTGVRVSLNAPTEFTGSATGSFTGSVQITSGSQLTLPTGSNQQAGTAVLDGANPGEVIVSNSLVTANSIILLTKQTLNHTNGYVSVSAKSAGSFTITSNHNGDTDTVGWFIINNS
jgi:hypothetical protein